MKFIAITAVALLGSAAVSAQSTGTGSPTTGPGATTNPAPGTMPPTETMTPTPTDSAATGAASSLTEEAARQKLASAGYGSVNTLQRNADGQWEATMKKGSKQQRVFIAPDGTVTPNTN